MKSTIGRNLYVLFILETKLVDIFSSAQSKIDGFSGKFRFDRSNMRRNVFQDIPFPQLYFKSECYIETVPVVINLKKRKWFLSRSYNPQEIPFQTSLIP